MSWVPLSVRRSKKRPAFEDPGDGIPPHLIQPVVEWVANNYFMTGERDLMTRARTLNPQVLKSTGILLRVPLDWNYGAPTAYESLLKQCSQDHDLFLDLVDLALSRVNDQEATAELHAMLVVGGAAFEVAPDGRQLSPRTPQVVRDAAKDAIAPGDRAAQLLAESWKHIYGRHPDPSSGYREAIRAVESIATPVVVPAEKLATLGRVIARLKETPAKFSCALDGPGSEPIGTVRSMMQLIWKSQLDRHGTADEDVPLHVSQQEAEAALQMAITLVEWFRRGFVSGK